MALNFVRRDDLSDGDLKALLGQKERDHCREVPRICARDEMLPKAAALAVEARIPFTFGVNDSTALRKAWQMGPAKTGSKTQLPESDGYCAYSPAFSQFVYRPKLVDRMAEAVETADKYEQTLRKVPKLKPTQ